MKKSPQIESAGSVKQHKYKKFRVNMPKKLGLISGKKYFFIESENGYVLNFGKGLYIGMPKILIENNPQLYTVVEGGEQ